MVFIVASMLILIKRCRRRGFSRFISSLQTSVMGVFCVFGLVNPSVFGLWPLWEGWLVSKEKCGRRRRRLDHGGGGRAGPEWSDHSQLEPSEVKTPFQQEEVDFQKGGVFFRFWETVFSNVVQRHTSIWRVTDQSQSFSWICNMKNFAIWRILDIFLQLYYG